MTVEGGVHRHTATQFTQCTLIGVEVEAVVTGPIIFFGVRGRGSCVERRFFRASRGPGAHVRLCAVRRAPVRLAAARRGGTFAFSTSFYLSLLFF